MLNSADDDADRRGVRRRDAHGPGYEYIVVGANTSSFNVGGGLTTSNYPASPFGATCSTLSSSNGTLTWRHHLDDTATVLPTADWQYNAGADGNCNSISLTAAAATAGYAVAVGQTVGVFDLHIFSDRECFLSQDIYELSYTAANPTVNLAGAAVIRDFYSWLKGNSGSSSGPVHYGLHQRYLLMDVVAAGAHDQRLPPSRLQRRPERQASLGRNGELGSAPVLASAGPTAGRTPREPNATASSTSGSRASSRLRMRRRPIRSRARPTGATPNARRTIPVLMNLDACSGNEYWVKGASLRTPIRPDHSICRTISAVTLLLHVRFSAWWRHAIHQDLARAVPELQDPPILTIPDARCTSLSISV